MRGDTQISNEGKRIIRRWINILLILFILNLIVLIGFAIYLNTLNDLIGYWGFYLTIVLMVISLIGLFMYKKWGFYFFVIYFMYTTIENLILFDFTRILIYTIFYGYIIGYRGFYRNFLTSNEIKSKTIIQPLTKKKPHWVFIYILAIVELLFGVFFFSMLLYAIFGYERDFLIISIFVLLSLVFLLGSWNTLKLGKKWRIGKQS